MNPGLWYTCNLGDAMLAGPVMDELEKQFDTAWKQAGQPRDAAVFIRHESEGQLHCDVVAWFSPASRKIAVPLGAHASGAPSQRGLSLLAGSPACLELLLRPPGDAAGS